MLLLEFRCGGVRRNVYLCDISEQHDTTIILANMEINI